MTRQSAAAMQVALLLHSWICYVLVAAWPAGAPLHHQCWSARNVMQRTFEQSALLTSLRGLALTSAVGTVSIKCIFRCDHSCANVWQLHMQIVSMCLSPSKQPVRLSKCTHLRSAIVSNMSAWIVHHWQVAIKESAQRYRNRCTACKAPDSMTTSQHAHMRGEEYSAHCC